MMNPERTTNRARRRPELLLPGGSLDVLKISVLYGADAVYIGGGAYGLRAKAANFSPEEMREGIRFAHERGAKVYVTANVFAHNGDLPGAEAYFRELADIKPDAVLISDPGMFDLASRFCPDIDIHISTQANTTNYASCLFWHRMGAKRIVTARELSLKEIREIRDRIPEDLEIECFVHGAMCISYSGRCLLSSYFTGRDANRGLCTHPCRWRYHLMEETRPGEYLPVEENERGTYIFNSRDLCMIDHIPDLMEAGIDSFKIEGRMKTALYAANCAAAYREAIDDCERSPALYESRLDHYRERISEGTYRRFTTGFFYGRPDENAQIYDSNTYVKSCTLIGIVAGRDADGAAVFTQKNKFEAGEDLELMKPDGRILQVRCRGIRNAEGESVPSAPHPMEELHVDLGVEAEPYDIVRRREKEL